MKDKLNALKSPLYRIIAPMAIAGAISLTSCYANPIPAKPIEPEPTPIVQTTPVIQKYIVKGVSFHDYNGDGIKEENEPVVPDVFLRFSLTDNVTTNEKGMYEIPLSSGKYELNIFVNKVLGYNDQPFNYISISKAEVKNINDDFNLEINTDKNYDIALMQGFLTLPFGPNTKFLDPSPFGIVNYFDTGDTTAWNGSGKTYSGHRGTDFYMEQNTPILAAAPGTVIEWEDLWKLMGNPAYFNAGNVVFIQNDQENFATLYGHLNEIHVKPGDIVKRGDIIGLSGTIHWGKYGGDHLHFEINRIWQRSPHLIFTFHDPYRNITNKMIYSLWTVDNNPQYP